MTTLQKITRRAKQLRKKHPGTAYRTLQRRAAAELKGKRPKRKKKVVRRSVRRSRRKVGRVGLVPGAIPSAIFAAVGSISYHKSEACKILKHKLAGELVKRELAKTKTVRRKLSKKIAATKRAIKNFK
jgi:hypothetical protein